MALESGDYIDDLVATNPAAGDPIHQADDHLRLVKAILKACFPGLDGALLNSAGRVLTARLGTGTRTSSTIFHGDGVFRALAGGGTEAQALLTRLDGRIGKDTGWTDDAVDGDDIVSSNTTHYTAPSGIAAAIVRKITVTNTHTAARTARVYLGTTSSLATEILHAEVLPGDTIRLAGPFMLAAGQQIRSASPNATANQVGLRAEVSELASAISGVTIRTLAGAALTTSQATRYTCPANRTTQVYTMTVCNVNAASRDVEIEIRPSGGSAQNRQRILSGPVLGGDTVILHGVTMKAGDTVRGRASAGSSVSLRLSVVEWS